MEWRAPFAPHDRLKKLASRLDALSERDENRIRKAREIAALRLEGARALHASCVSLVRSLNSLLTQVQMELSPPEFPEDGYRDSGKNIYQINVRGRILQMTFEATAGLCSTENFRIPYIIEGAIRWFNQEKLDKEALDEHALFYCLEKKGRSWRYLDPRSQRTGEVEDDYLVGLMEQLL